MPLAAGKDSGACSEHYENVLVLVQFRLLAVGSQKINKAGFHNSFMSGAVCSQPSLVTSFRELQSCSLADGALDTSGHYDEINTQLNPSVIVSQ